MSSDTPRDDKRNFPKAASEDALDLTVELRRLYTDVQRVAHDVRSSLGIVDNVIKLYVPDELKKIGRQNVEHIGRLIESMANDALTPHSCEEFQTMLSTIAVGLKAGGLREVRVELCNLAEGREQLCVLASETLWESILTNLVSNAARKGATTMQINLEWSTMPDSELAALKTVLHDNGIGMKPDILEKVRKGEWVTDKTPGDGQTQENISKHGRGLQNMRAIIEEKLHGAIFVDSIERSSGSPDHGTTYAIFMPGYSKEHMESASHTMRHAMETSREMPEPVASSRMSRRRVFVLGGAATAAAVAGILLRRSFSDEDELAASTDEIVLPDHPLSRITLDAQGRITSFTADLIDTRVTFDRDGTSDVLRNVRMVDLNDASIVAFDVAMKEGLSQPMFISSTKSGIFAYMHMYRRSNRKAAYVCAPKRNGVSQSSRDQSHLLQDTVIDDAYYATSAAFLQSKDLSAMQPSLARLEKSLQADDAKKTSPPFVAHVLQRLLATHDLSQKRAVTVRTSKELEEQLEGSDHFIIAERPIVEYLASHPLPQERTMRLRQRKNELCLLGIEPDVARRIVRN